MAIIRVHKDALRQKPFIHHVKNTNLIEWLANSDYQEIGNQGAIILHNGRVIADSAKHDDINDRCDFNVGFFDEIDVIARPNGTEIIVAIVVAVVAAGIAIALAPKPEIPNDLGKTSESPNNQLSAATNSFRPRQAIPDIAGEVISYPDFIQPSYYEFVDNLKIVKEIFCVGVGQYDISEVKSSNTLIDDIEGSSYIVHPPGSTPALLLNVRGTNEIDGQVITPPNDTSITLFITGGTISPAGGGGSNIIGATEDDIDRIGLLVGDDVLIQGNYQVGGSPQTVDAIREVTAITGSTITVSPSILASDPGTANISVTNLDARDSTYSYVTLEGDQVEEIWFHIVAPRGIRTDTGEEFTINFTLRAQEIDEFGVDIGSPIEKVVSVTENTLNEVYRTFKLTSADGITAGRYKASIIRDTDSTVESATDLVKIIDIQSVTPYTASFGDVTLIEVDRRATIQAISQSQSKINCLAKRKLELFDFDTGTFDTGVFTHTRDFRQYVMYCLDKLGKIDTKYINYSDLEATADNYIATNPEYGYFDFTFDSEDVSLRDRISTACNAARVRYYNVGNLFRFVREEVRPIRAALFNRRNLAPRSASQTFKFTRGNDFDSIELQYVDPNTNAEAYVRRKVNPTTGAIESGLGDRISKITLGGCRNESQAENRCELEIRKIKYLRRSVQDVALSEALTIGVGERVGWADFNDSQIFHGEILNQNGDLFETSEKFTPEPGVDYYVYITDQDGNVSNSVIATEHPSTEFGFQASGLVAYNADGYQTQLGSKYIIASQSDVSASDFTVVKRGRPNDRGECQIELIQYDDRVFEQD